MAKVTRTQEFNEFAKQAQFFCATSNRGGIVIVVDYASDGVLWRKCYGDYEHTARRWQTIKWTVPRYEDQESRPYFTIYGTRYYLDDFMRCA